MSDQDRQMITDEVEFIYHCAAIIRFDETLTNMVIIQGDHSFLTDDNMKLH